MAAGEVPNGGWGWMVVFGVAFSYVSEAVNQDRTRAKG